MSCNTQQLNITCGTDVALHDRLIFEGETFDPNLSVGIAANLVSSLGKRTALDVQVVDDELLISVPWVDGTLPGCYGLEVTGSCNSKKWATYADSLIKYTKATRIGVSEVTVESDSYDITQEVGYRYSDSPVKYATATIDDNVGEPSVDVTYEQHVLGFEFHNMKGEPGEKGDQGIQGEQGEKGEQGEQGEKGDSFTYEDFTPQQLAGLVGPQGPQGDSAVYDPSDPDAPDFVMANTTGDSTTKAMTQKAVTDAIEDLAKANIVKTPVDLSSIANSSFGYNSSTGKSTSMSAGYYAKYVPVTIGHTYIISPIDASHRVSMATFMSVPTAANQNASISGDCFKLLGDKNYVGELGDSVAIKIETANFIYIRVDTASNSQSCVGSIVDVDEDVALVNSHVTCYLQNNGVNVLPVTCAENVLWGDTNAEEVFDSLRKTVSIKAIPISRTAINNIGWSTENIGLVKGKKYKVRAYTNLQHTSDIQFYLRDHSSATSPVSFNLGTEILTGLFNSAEIIYECVDDTAQYLSAYCSQKKAANYGVVFEELGLVENAPEDEVENGMYTNETPEMVQGGVDQGAPYSATTRIRTKELRYVVDGCFFVEVGNGYQFMVSYFSETGAFVKTSNSGYWREGKWKDSWKGFIAIAVRCYDDAVLTPSAETGLILHRNVKQMIGSTDAASEIGFNGGCVTIKQTGVFEQGVIDTGADASANNCMRTPSNNPIKVGVGKIKCVFTVPKPKTNSPWSKPYFYKDGLCVNPDEIAFQINNETVWEHDCDGTFNEIRFRVYVSSVAAADIAASSVDCTFVSNGSGVMGELNAIKNGLSVRNLYIGKLLQSSVGSYGALKDDSTNYVCMADVLQLPFNGVRMSVKTTSRINVAIALGANGGDMATYALMRDGGALTVPSQYNYYQIFFAITNTEGTPTSAIALEDVEKLIASGDISITYEVAGDDNILHSRPEAEIASRALKISGNLMVCHTSDQHGNVYGMSNVYKFADYVGADLIMNTGDTCSLEPRNGFEYAKALADGYGIPTLVCAGNHDGYNVTGESDIRTKFIDKFVTNGYHISDGKTYYYYDIAAKNIRFVMLNTSQTGYSTFNDQGCIMQDQIDFLVDTLESTPSGYGVIIGFHFPLGRKEIMISNDWGFLNKKPSSQWEHNLVFAQPILDIIDAYIGRTTFDISYTNIDDGKMNDGSGTSVSKTGNFANAHGEFICYMTGHTHQDRVAYFANTTHKQLCLNITCTANCDFQAAGELPRKGDGVCTNAFNIYSVDMTAKKVHVLRVGSDMNDECISRKMISIDYTDD